MERALRKRHRQIWYAMVMIVPPLLLLSWLVIPDTAPVKEIRIAPATVLPEIVYAGGTENFQANLRSNADRTIWQLEWINKKVLAVPSAVIYKSNGNTFDPAAAQIAGRIETKGRYYFPLQDTTAIRRPVKLIVYDFIHERVIDSINF